jgi:hypothetical protein
LCLAASALLAKCLLAAWQANAESYFFNSSAGMTGSST